MHWHRHPFHGGNQGVPSVDTDSSIATTLSDAPDDERFTPAWRSECRKDGGEEKSERELKFIGTIGNSRR